MEALRKATRNLAAVGAPDPVRRLLAPARRLSAREVLTRFRPRADALASRLERGDPDAREELAALAEEALSAMRRGVLAKAAERGGAINWAASVDEWWRHTEEGEYLDDPEVDQAVRVRIVSHLDAMNELLGSYQLFFERVRPWLRESAGTRLLDLAAGHGGFALAIARHARDEGIALEVVASDIKHEYLALGARRAESEELAVAFAEQDALDLSNLSPGEYDIVTCTQ